MRGIRRIDRINLIQRAGSSPQYEQRILSLNPTGYWPFDEPSGAVLDHSGHNYNGVISGTVTQGAAGFNDGHTAYLFGGSGLANINAAGFPGAFNATEGTLLAYLTLDPSSVWNDGGTRYFWYFAADASNRIGMRKEPTGGLNAFYQAGGTLSGLNLKYLASAEITPFLWGLSYSKSNNRVYVIVNGTPSIALTGLGVWAGSASTFQIGGTWKGRGQHAMYWNRELSLAQIWSLARNTTGQIVFDGDSRTAVKLYPDRAYSASGALSKGYGFGNWGVSGRPVSTMISDAPGGVDTLRRTGRDILVLLGGVNDSPTANATTIYGRIRSYCQDRRAAGWWKIFVCSEVDAQDATRNTAGWHGTIWPALNGMLRDDHNFCDGLIDLGGNAAFQNANDLTYYNADKLHWSNAGYDLAGDLVGAALNAVI